MLDGFLAVPTHVMVRFGMWEELIASPKPADDLYLTSAFWHYGRCVAFAASGRVDEATEEYDALLSAYQQVPDSRRIGNNPGNVDVLYTCCLHEVAVAQLGGYACRGSLQVHAISNRSERFALGDVEAEADVRHRRGRDRS